MPVWPWLVAPALMLLLIVGFTVAGFLLVRRIDTPASQTEPEEPVAALVQPEPVPAAPAEPVTAEPRDGPPEVARSEPPRMALPLPAREPQRAPEPAARAPARSAGRSDPKLPQLSEALRIRAPGEPVPQEVPRASAEREALYDTVVQRFVLYDIGRLRGPAGQQAALDFEALGPEAMRALVRGLNQSASLEASCPVVSISDKLGRLLATCSDPELLAEVRDGVGKGVGPTLHHAYLTAVKQACAERLKTVKEPLRARVPHLVAALKSKDPEARRKAANTLGLAGADAKAAVPALVEALKDGDPEARGYAASALAAVGAPAVPALLKAATAGADRQAGGLAELALQAIDPDFRAALAAVRQAPPAQPKADAVKSTREPCYRTVTELAVAATGPGDAARSALRELALRHGEQALTALVLAAVSDDRERRELGRELLLRFLTGRPDDAAEEEAARRLKLARRLPDGSAGGKTKDSLRALIKAHPRSRAAEEARQLLADAQE